MEQMLDVRVCASTSKIPVIKLDTLLSIIKCNIFNKTESPFKRKTWDGQNDQKGSDKI